LSTAHAVRMHGVTKSYGEHRALNALDLTVQRGACTALLGPNGAGKTTTMRILTGQLAVDSGTVEVFGEPLARAGSAVKARIGLVPQNDNLESELTVRDNLDIYARLYGIGRARRAENLDTALEATGLATHATRKVDALSGGYRRRALIARALVSEPELLILDEPTVGLDPEVRFAILDTLGKLKAAGMSIVVASHYIDELSQLIDDVAIIRDGVVVRSSTVDELSASFADHRTVSVQGQAAAALLRRASGKDAQVVPLTMGEEGTRYVVHADLLDGGHVPADTPARALTFSEMYLAALRTS
jgi:lipooligosaccharide transport system ATP-binding protein